MLQRLDQHVHRLLLEVQQDFLQRAFDPSHLGGDVHTDLAQGPGLFLQPLPMAIDVAQAHLLQSLFVDQTGSRQPLQIIESDDVQRRIFGLGQRRGAVEGGAVFHQGRGDQHES
ncbi:hypothetical protein D3C86_1714720 [compost metagenome]